MEIHLARIAVNEGFNSQSGYETKAFHGDIIDVMGVMGYCLEFSIKSWELESTISGIFFERASTSKDGDV